ncbi:MAG: multidrug effflux MFS transporter [Deltaproteobacteria bacterium]
MSRPAPRLGTVELIAMIAALMSLNALAIDVMLPALPAMGDALGVTTENHRQYVIIAFVLGMGTGQLFFGPLSDAFGRKSVLVVSLAGYAVFGAACAFPGSFAQLVAFRALQGLFAAGARVTALSVVRDKAAGPKMARIMSFVMAVFMIVPIVAPGLGYVILKGFSWRAIFWALVLFGVSLCVWLLLRLPETLPKDQRRSIRPRAILRGYVEVVRHPISRSYTLATGLVFGALFAFISSSEQIFRSFDRVETFPLFFAGVASTMAMASVFNARFVERIGTRRLSHAALGTFVAVQIVYGGLYFSGFEGFWPYYLCTGASFFTFSMMGANFNAMAMEPLGHVAGTASAALGFTSTTISGVLGGLIAARFDGTPLPIVLGFGVLGVAAMLVVTFGPGRPAMATVTS